VTEDTRLILAGDVGGTKADLALFEPGGTARAPRFDRRLPTREFATFDALLDAFLAEARVKPDRAVFGIAGPVIANRVETTNLPWTLDGEALGDRLGARVTLLNDLATTAWGLPELEGDDLETLKPGDSVDGNRALIAAGTGLGESILARTPSGWVALATEGGHTDFGPRDPLEDELLVWLRGRYGRVSYERILSGPGLADLYRFLRDTNHGADTAAFAARFDAAADPAAEVTAGALDGSSGRARLAVEKFVDLYGSEAGNLALKSLAVGGVFVGGGIAPRLLPFLRDGRFARSFANKGRLAPVLERIPVRVVLDPRASLWGAAAFARAHP
jgi:glucokinase